VEGWVDLSTAVSVQPVPKAAYRSDFREKHKLFCLKRDSILGPVAQQASVLPLDHCDLQHTWPTSAAVQRASHGVRRWNADDRPLPPAIAPHTASPSPAGPASASTPVSPAQHKHSDVFDWGSQFFRGEEEKGKAFLWCFSSVGRAPTSAAEPSVQLDLESGTICR